VDIEQYWKLTIGITLGICLVVFGSVFWNSATEDYYNKLTNKKYKNLDKKFLEDALMTSIAGISAAMKNTG